MSRILSRLVLTLIAACCLVVAVGCGTLDADQEQDKPKATKVTVEIFDFKLRPQTLEVSEGTKVTWINKDPVDHTVTANDGSFDKLLKSGDKYSFTFKKKGTYKYSDRLNEQPGLSGNVVVE